MFLLSIFKISLCPIIFKKLTMIEKIDLNFTIWISSFDYGFGDHTLKHGLAAIHVNRLPGDEGRRIAA